MQSCGFSIPIFSYVSDRPTLDEWARRKIANDLDAASDDDDTTVPIGPVGKGGLREYWATKNAVSVHSGLPGLTDLVSGTTTPDNQELAKTKVTPGFKYPDYAYRMKLQADLTKQRYWDVGLALSCMVLGIAIGFSCVDVFHSLIELALKR
jgi:hypothetical protein